jgi:DNA processing protein
VGTGLDVIYPVANADLWRRVAAVGTVVSEYPLGTRPQAWRFPARNRIIAALADVVVVVESHAQGGSLHTVDAALERDRPVMAVPGPVRSPASAGTNELLVAGSGVVRDASDMLLALGLDAGATGRGGGDPGAPGCDSPGGRSGAGPLGTAVLEALGWEPATVEEVVGRVGAPLADVAVVLSRMEGDGRLVRHGGWLERRDRPR